MLSKKTIRMRILRKAQQHDLFNKHCFRWEDTPRNLRLKIKEQACYESDPILVFGNDDSKWTILSETELVTFYDGVVSRCELTEFCITHISQDQYQEPPSRNKLESEFLILEPQGFKVWVPNGKELFALWNILLIFN